MKKATLLFFSWLLVFSSLVPSIGHSVASAEDAPHRYHVDSVLASVHDGNVPENTLDDDLGTRWSAQGEGEWIQYDLGRVEELGYLGVAFHSGNVRKSTIGVELSVDGSEWSKVVSQFESSGESINLELVDFDDQTARYVRIIGYGNSSNAWNSLTAVHIYAPGEPVVEQLTVLDPGPKPDAKPFTKAGLYYPDETEYVPHTPNAVTGVTLNVLDFGADTQDSDHDDTPAIIAAIEAAQPGDEVYFPNGIYNLRGTMPNDHTSHFYLKNGVNLRGQSEKGVKLVSHFDVKEVPNSKVITSYGRHDVVVSNLTITSTFDGAYSENPSVNNPERGGPGYGIFIADFAGQASHHITIDQVTIEKFQRMGIRIEKSNRVVVENSTFRNATDVGGGGAGYGVTIQGIQGIDRLGHANDTYFNVVRNNSFEGPYMRHGTLIQNFAHNNLVDGNKYKDNIHDAIDLHGQGEYLNEVRNNRVDGVIRGGIGVGNTGGTAPNSHSASGEGNYIHHNTLTNTRDGITVIMGSPGTVIEKNTIVNTRGPANSKGIYLLNAPRTVVKDNTIVNNRASGFWAIYIAEDLGDRNNNNKGAGIPEDITVINNKIVNSTNGIRIEAGKRITVENNLLQNISGEEFVYLINEEDEKEVINVALNPTDDAKVDIQSPDSNYGVYNQDLLSNVNFYKYFNIKSNSSKTTGRVAYFKYDLSDINEISSAAFQLTGKTGSNTTSVELAVFAILENNWDEETITWNNAPNLADNVVEVTGVDETAFYIGSFTVDQADNAEYSVDVTEFVKMRTMKSVS
ncbi:right-handed parallel beta-helix repeat-containing protein [Anaerobacillus sp. CMMVII]|uniref:right-handed parallel beta-helix repeat-containing protein n=1 Tax=Anaerobacillus sp. CMMVII TaxID=2755588 RepID=UPI0021B77422|nr:right-handed parallel beta-helix repeat-containing protein [Anaerobacillus sp. CMMVII]MCT8140274.1 right-handed parallel beta-helix repeat-containing protein [Anaerobacillus sp. CMMVII]